MRTFILLFILFIVPPVNPSSTPIVEIKQTEMNPSQLEDFLMALGHQESGNRYNVVNRYGYMGRYQFGKSTLRTLKIKVDKKTFLNNPQLQEYAMLKLLCYNKSKLQKYIDEFEGQEINGILVTESGLLAAAHLGGPNSVKRWFKNGKVAKDGNGVKITQYILL